MLDAPHRVPYYPDLTVQTEALAILWEESKFEKDKRVPARDGMRLPGL